MTPLSAHPAKRAAGLYSIIAIKLIKGFLLFGLALGIYSLLGNDLRSEFDRFLRWISLDPEQKLFALLGEKIQQITPDNIRWIAWGALLYSLLLFAESIGMLFRAFWAAWLAIGETAFLIPFEIHRLLEEFSAAVLAVLIINTAIVWYLVRNRNRLFHHHRHGPA